MDRHPPLRIELVVDDERQDLRFSLKENGPDFS
jgi:hypothetical protein